MEGEGPHVDAFVPADDVPTGLVKDTGKSKCDFALDTAFDKLIGKIEGKPGTNDPDDARREAYLAYELAKRPDVTHVLLGDPAIKFMYGRGKRSGEQDVDVIALLAGKDAIIGDSKGWHFGKALVEQLPHSTQALKDRGFQVVEGIVLARQPQTVIASLPADGQPFWKLVGVQHASIDPVEMSKGDGRFPFDPRYIYLLDQKFHDVHNPAGLAIEPHVRFPQLRTHIDAPLLSPRFHMTSGTWSNMRPFIIPTTVAPVKIGFVRK